MNIDLNNQIHGVIAPRSDLQHLSSQRRLESPKPILGISEQREKLPLVEKLHLTFYHWLWFTINVRLTTLENVVIRQEATTEHFPARRFRKEQAPRIKLFSTSSGPLLAPNTNRPVKSFFEALVNGAFRDPSHYSVSRVKLLALEQNGTRRRWPLRMLPGCRLRCVQRLKVWNSGNDRASKTTLKPFEVIERKGLCWNLGNDFLSTCPTSSPSSQAVNCETLNSESSKIKTPNWKELSQ